MLANAVFCEESLGKNHALYVHVTHMLIIFGTGRCIILFESLQKGKVQACSQEITYDPCLSSNYENTMTKTYDYRLEDVDAYCFGASLLHMQIHITHHVLSAR